MGREQQKLTELVHIVEFLSTFDLNNYKHNLNGYMLRNILQIFNDYLKFDFYRFFS